MESYNRDVGEQRIAMEDRLTTTLQRVPVGNVGEVLVYPCSVGDV